MPNCQKQQQTTTNKVVKKQAKLCMVHLVNYPTSGTANTPKTTRSVKKNYNSTTSTKKKKQHSNQQAISNFNNYNYT